MKIRTKIGMKTYFYSHSYANFHLSVTLVFCSDLMKFSLKYKMIYIILGSFCSYLNWEGTNIRPQIKPRKIPALCPANGTVKFKHTHVNCLKNVASHQGLYKISKQVNTD